MSAIAAFPTHASVFFYADDRAVGDEGVAQRDYLSATGIGDDVSTIDVRGEDIYRSVESALQAANTDDGTLVSVDAFSRTIEFLLMLPAEIPLPAVVVEGASEIGLDWDEGARRVLSLTVRDTPFIGFAAMFGAEPLYGRVPFGSEIPETLRFLFRRLYPPSSSR